MMRVAAFSAAGFLLGSLLAVGAILLLGLLLHSLGLQLYDSEASQQRNFNLAIGFTVAAALLGTWFGYRLGKR
jgi:hypothetical protein